MSELKPCPFCGGEAELYRPALSKHWRVGCNACGCSTEPCYDDKPATVAAWNTRAPDPRITQLEADRAVLVEAARQALHCTPSIQYAHSAEAFILYDCGDPWAILRQALSTIQGDGQ